MRDASIGVSVSATKSERPTEPATVSPNSPRKLPTIPSTKTTGRNTAITDAVAAVAANAICRAPISAALRVDSPDSRCRSMFSSTMIASSITTPTASAMPSSVIVFSV